MYLLAINIYLGLVIKIEVYFLSGKDTSFGYINDFLNWLNSNTVQLRESPIEHALTFTGWRSWIPLSMSLTSRHAMSKDLIAFIADVENSGVHKALSIRTTES